MNLCWVPLLILGLVLAACSPLSTPSSPDMTAGVFLYTGYAFYRWEEGLNLMIWHDGIQSSNCGSSSSTSDPKFTLACHALSRTNVSFEWRLETEDGKTANFSIDDNSFDLKQGHVFLITSSSGMAKIQQVKRFPSNVIPTTERVSGYALSVPVINEFIYSTSELQFALRSLISFFEHLHSGEYEQAAALYKGNYGILQHHNPELDPENHGSLFRNTCEVNGAQCLEIEKAVFDGKSSPNKFKFVVQFKNEDGSLFTPGPCCGEANPSLQSEFIYAVERSAAGDYQVLDLPIFAS